MVFGTIIGVHLIYQQITYIDQQRALKIGTEHTYVLRASRGNIYDTNGDIIARSDTSYDIHLDCAVMKAGFRDSAKMEFVTGQLAARMAKLLTQKDSASWQEHINKGCESGNIDSVKTFPVFDLHQFRGGGIVDTVLKRVYPYGMLGRRTIGDIRRAPMTFGLERSYDCFLAGLDGYKTTRHGRHEGRDINKVSAYIPAKEGCDVYTTLDMAMQATADSILRRAIIDNEEIVEGCFVLLEKETGAIRAMVNLSQTEDGLFELRNTAIEALCEPGSLGQIMTYAALLNDGYIHSLSDTIATHHGLISRGLPRDEHIVDYERRNSTSSISIRDGFAMSSRYVPSMLANKFYGDAPEKFTSRIQSYFPGFTFDLDGLRKNVVPEPESRVWSSRDLPIMAYGYGLFVTPLEVLNFYNAILNQGHIVQPFLVERIVEKSNQVKLHEKASLGQIMPEHVADTLLRELRYASCSEAFIGKSSVVRISLPNKDSQDGYHDAVSCMGFFPVNEPQYTVICMLYGKSINSPFYYGKGVVEYIVNDFVKQQAHD